MLENNEKTTYYKDEKLTPPRDVICNYPGCDQVATLGKPKDPIRCNKHKEPGMKFSYSGICIVEGCTTTASWSKPGCKKKRVYCSYHGKERGGSSNEKLCIECKVTQPSWFDKPKELGGKKCLCNGCVNIHRNKYPDAQTGSSLCVDCKKIAHSYGTIEEFSRLWCKECSKNHPGAVVISNRQCDKCKQTRACFSIDGVNTKYCKKCAAEESNKVVNMVSKKCEICNEKLANYGLLEERVRRWCVDCKDKVGKPSELKTSRCKHPGCKTQPRMGLPEGKITHCTKHATDDMVLLRKVRMCQECHMIAPSYGYNSVFTHCSKCKLPDMERCQVKYCHHDGCKIIPVFGYKDKKPISCATHKASDMSDVCNRMCTTCNITQANYGYPGSTREKCNRCKEDDMIDLTHRKCDLCNIIAYYGYKKYKPTRCFRHIETGMVDVINKRCYKCGLTITLDKLLCSKCDPENSRLKRHEEAVVKYLQQKFPENNFVHDKRLPNTKIKFRPDILYAISDDSTKDVLWYLIVEVDENQHKGKEPIAEEERMYSIHQVLGKPCTFIRYNPDSFSIDGKRMSKEYPTEKRLELLKKKVKRHMSRQPVGVHVCKICFDDYVISGYELDYTPHV